LRQGLITLPALYYYEENPGDPDLQILLAGKLLNDQRLDRLVSAIRKSGAIQQAADEARDQIDCALKILLEQPPGAERDALEDLSRYIISRRF
jgi:geranylgeranyl pyrophosphate synthase